jgi:hypothetical protein
MKSSRSALGVLAIGFAVISHAEADDWSFEFEPYLMASSIEGDAGVGRVQEAAVSVDFSDILETLEIGAMAAFAGQHESGWGFSLDYGFMDLRTDISGPRGGVADARVRQGVFEALVTRKAGPGDELHYFAGIRWWDNDLDLSIDPALLPLNPMLSTKEDWVDFVAGFQWTRSVSEEWTFSLRGDVGGLGMESDWTASAVIGFRYGINDRLDLDLKYKALWVDYETGNPGQPGYFAYDTVTHGPIAGLVFKF